MAKAITFARTIVPVLPMGEVLRVAFVSGCGAALALAGPVLPL